jgi:tetratricopeptide (TPR) repeat protein
MSRGWPAVLVLALLALAAPAAPAGQQAEERPQVLSPFGKTFFSKPDTDGTVAKADAALAADPGNVALMIAAGRARDGVLQYKEAIDFYSRAIAAAPSDVRGYRFRGHRYISTRQIPEAVRDLERARILAPASFDVAYHLGLAYFLAGEFAKAADEYGRCLGSKEEAALPEGWRSCAAAAASDDDRVAITDWRYRALRRAGKHGPAAQSLGSIVEGMAVKENAAYYQALLFYKGLRSEDDVLAPKTLQDNTFVTTAFGAANFYLAEKREADACRLLRAIVADDLHWNGFGYIAAETELSGRLRKICQPRG